MRKNDQRGAQAHKSSGNNFCNTFGGIAASQCYGITGISVEGKLLKPLRLLNGRIRYLGIGRGTTNNFEEPETADMTICLVRKVFSLPISCELRHKSAESDRSIPCCAKETKAFRKEERLDQCDRAYMRWTRHEKAQKSDEKYQKRLVDISFILFQNCWKPT